MRTLVFALVLGLFGLGGLCPLTLAQQTLSGVSIVFPTTVQWTKHRGVTTYRLQIAADEAFGDIFYDGPVYGERYVVTNLAPGYYYWRAAPAGSQSLPFLKPIRFFVSGGVVVSAVRQAGMSKRPRVFAMRSSRVH